ncbi:ferritin [Clostridium sp. 'White wine YQ']|uniref:ferritin n=1 Tax=Clostridium sp. 'White wine YQ' TaxID=3027474 RepID=UPI002366F9E9|nr:ferritin [Clostridium sp. 'White wine YQ']MDD7795789.1 ferritin [Clostridium sp. 'White wine YQ']
MFSTKLLDALNHQVNYEFYSSYSYLSMAAYCESIDLPGFSNFFRVQAQEELFHAMKFFDYIQQKNGEIILEKIDQPTITFESVAHVFETAFEHEQIVTKKIYNLADIATEEREHATLSLLKWFIDEQVEEENTFDTILKKLKRAKDNPAALYLLDDELAKRVYTPPAATN